MRFIWATTCPSVCPRHGRCRTGFPRLWSWPYRGIWVWSWVWRGARTPGAVSHRGWLARCPRVRNDRLCPCSCPMVLFPSLSSAKLRPELATLRIKLDHARGVLTPRPFSPTPRALPKNQSRGFTPQETNGAPLDPQAALCRYR